MESQTLSEKADAYLKRLCLEIESRSVGSAGNRAATDFFASAIGSFGFEVATPAFDCIDWIADGAECSVDGERFEVLTSPYSLGCQVRGGARHRLHGGGA